MKLPILNVNNVSAPSKGFGFAFIDVEDKKLKIKKHDGVIEFTNNLSDIQLLDLSDYTAFEVLAHDTDINAGDIDEVTGIAYAEHVSAQMTHKMILRTSTPKEQQDVIIDWGDGAVASVKDGDFEAELSDNQFVMSHTYQNPGRYIVKIYGKQYYAVKYSDSQYSGISRYNLICRVLDYDLPIASHLTNLSSFCFHATRLQKVNVPKYADYLTRIINTAYMFNFCKNLVSVRGFNNCINPAFYSYDSMFDTCTALSECDFRMSPYITGNSIVRVFSSCSALTIDINKLLSTQNFQVSKLSVNNMFSNSGITGTVPADKLWNDSNIEWTDTETAFIGCSDEIRAQVPESWGGTASDDIIEKYDNEKIDADFTEFVLWAHNENIEKGTYLKLLDGLKAPEILSSKPTDMTNVVRVTAYGNTISASLTHEFFLKCPVKDISEYDIQVDWGDGTIENATNALKSGNERETLLKFSHTYANEGLYSLRISGQDYYGIPVTTSENPSLSLNATNLIHKVNRIGSNVTNWFNMFNWALRLFHFNLSNYNKSVLNCCNLYNTFYNCENLVTCYGFYPFIGKITTCQNLFNGCKSLIDTDFVLPNNTEKIDLRYTFAQCISLNKPVEQFLPSTGFTQKEINVKGCFGQCANMYSNTNGAFGKLLWGDKNVRWFDTNSAFSNINVNFSKYIPVSWGGLNKSEEAKLKIKDKNYYTAFEVNPNKITFERNEYISNKYDSESLTKETDETKLIVNGQRAIPANTVHKLALRSCADVDSNDVVIEWGDGSYSAIINGEDAIAGYTSKTIDGAEFLYAFEHDYAASVPDNGSAKFIVKIYGKGYFNIVHQLSDLGGSNLMSRVFEEDLPIAPHIGSFQNFCKNALRLLYVNISPYSMINTIPNLIGCFAACSNLRIAVGLKRFYNTYSIKELFASCVALRVTDMRCSPWTTDATRCFYACYSLELNLSTFFNFPGFASKKIDLTEMFGCLSGSYAITTNENGIYVDTVNTRIYGSLKGTIPTNVLWDDSTVTFISKNCFANNPICDTISIPVSWGGKDSSIIIKDNIEKRLSIIEARMAQLDGSI
jgi:hypothetical protein